jgi:hypothetical protein
MNAAPDYLFVPLAEHELLLQHGCTLQPDLSGKASLTYIAEEFTFPDFIAAIVYIVRHQSWRAPKTFRNFLANLDPAWRGGSPEHIPHDGLQAVEYLGKLLAERGQPISLSANVMCLINRNEKLLESGQLNKLETEELLERSIALVKFKHLSAAQKISLAKSKTDFDMTEIETQMENGAPAALIAEMYSLSL